MVYFQWIHTMIPHFSNKYCCAQEDNGDYDRGFYDDIILASYFNITSLPANSLHSPLHKDSKPSFSFFIGRDGSVLYKDFALNQSGNIRQLMCELWHKTYSETKQIILSQLEREHNAIDLTQSNKYSYKPTANKLIQIHVKKWDNKSEQYWNSYGITKKQCQYVGIYPIDYYKINSTLVKASSLAFAYTEIFNNKIYYKIYQPYDKHKWINNYPNHIISLYKKIPYNGKHLIIASSVKDALCIWSNTKIPAIAFQSESNNLSNIDDIKFRYDHIYILYDNDETGLRQAKINADKYELHNIVIPQFPTGKDISDYYQYSKENMIMLIKQSLIND